MHNAPLYKQVGWQNPLMPYDWEFLKSHIFKGFIDITDTNSAEDFCHPPGTVCIVYVFISEIIWQTFDVIIDDPDLTE